MVSREGVAKMRLELLIKARFNRIQEITKKWRTSNYSNHLIIADKWLK